MYKLLNKHFSRKTADTLIGFWYAFLMLLVFLFASDPSAPFRYGNL
ncbi:MAG: hypothetical protein ACREEE_12675 [Dongiaceae bacterium]